MSTLLEQLHRDHGNLTRLLNTLEHAIRAFENGDDRTVTVMQDIVDYIGSHNERVHQLKEDLIYAKLAERDPASATVVAELHEEHRVLARLTREFATVLEDALLGTVMTRTALTTPAQDYLRRNRDHMDKEESRLFPAARDKLLEQDWTAIEKAAPEIIDPLFGPQVEARYRALFKNLL
jgi:hemerythrin-like domain-containing protein